MSGIVGLWNLDGRPASRAELGRMAGALAHRGPDGLGLRIEGAVGLACQLRRLGPADEVQPTVHPSGTMLVLDGRLDDREALAGAIGLDGRHASDPELLLAAHAALGEAFLERVAGDFALALFDPGRSALLLARDAVGVRPLYHARRGDLLVFASEIGAILAHPRFEASPDDEGLAAALLGKAASTDPTRTCFAGVHRLPPSHRLAIGPDRSLLRPTWDFDPGVRLRLGRIEEYGEAFREVFTRAVERRLDGSRPVAVSVSGGLDSSAILCAALERGGAARGISYSPADGSPADETAYLAHLEDHLSIAIERVPVAPLAFVDLSADHVRQAEVPILTELAGPLDRLHRRAGQGSRVLLTGHWGDQVLAGSAYLDDLFDSLDFGPVASHLATLARWNRDVEPGVFHRRFLLGLLRRRLPGPLVALLRRLRPRRGRPPTWFADGLARRLRPIASPRPPGSHHAVSLHAQVRSTHHLEAMEWNDKITARRGLECRFPFLDRDLIAFLMSIPGDVLAAGGVPKGLLRLGLGEVLPQPIALRRDKADFTHLVNRAVQMEYPRVMERLEGGGLAARRGYVEGPAVDRFLAGGPGRLRSRDCLDAWRLGELLALVLWLEACR